MILSFKLFITPLLIGLVTLAGRRWGAVISGLLVGLPLTTGPISFILAYEYGLEFASKAAIGNLVGQVSICVFCLTYIFMAQKSNWLTSVFTAIATFLTATLVWNSFSWSLLPAFTFLFASISLAIWVAPRYLVSPQTTNPPKWDLQARMIIATAFVVLLTSFAKVLGSQLSGLISPFPVFGSVLAAFTHHQQGGHAASNLLRGIILGSASFAFFFLIVGVLLTTSGIAITYILASMAAILVSSLIYFITQRKIFSVHQK